MSKECPQLDKWNQALAVEILSLLNSPAVWLFDKWCIMHNCQFWTFFWHLISYLNHLSLLQGYILCECLVKCNLLKITETVQSWQFSSAHVTCQPLTTTFECLFWIGPRVKRPTGGPSYRPLFRLECGRVKILELFNWSSPPDLIFDVHIQSIFLEDGVYLSGFIRLIFAVLPRKPKKMASKGNVNWCSQK